MKVDYSGLIQEVKSGDSSLNLTDFKGNLAQHQRIAANCALIAKRFAIFDKLGVGKTAEAIASILAIKEYDSPARVAIFVESSNLYQWASEIEKFSSLEPVVVRGTKKRRRRLLNEAYLSEDFVLLFTYGSILHDFEDLLNVGIRTTIYDEAATLGNENKTSKFARALSVKADYAIALTAEPIERGDMLQVYDLLHTLGITIMNRDAFISKFVKRKKLTLNIRRGKKTYSIVKYRVVGSKNEEELKKIIKPHCIRRGLSVWEDETWKIPEFRKFLRTYDLTRKQRSIYNEISDEILLAAEEKRPAKENWSALAKCLTDPSLVREVKQESPKVDVVLRILKELNNDQVIVFSRFYKTHDIFKKAFEDNNISFKQFTGEIPPKEREITREEFWEGKFRVLLCTTAAEKGVNLQCCNSIIFADILHTPKGVKQFIGRLRRKGQLSRFINVFFVAGDNTIEFSIFEKLYKRQLSADLVLGDSMAEFFDSETFEPVSFLKSN